MKRKLFYKSKAKFEEGEPIPSSDAKDWLGNKIAVNGLVTRALSTNHISTEIVDISLTAWKALDEANKNVLLIEYYLPEKVLVNQFRYFTDKQKSLSYEFQRVPFPLIKRRWNKLGESDKVRILTWQKLIVKFIDTIWYSLSDDCKLLCITHQEYLDRKELKDLPEFLVSSDPKIAKIAKERYDELKGDLIMKDMNNYTFKKVQEALIVSLKECIGEGQDNNGDGWIELQKGYLTQTEGAKTFIELTVIMKEKFDIYAAINFIFNAIGITEIGAFEDGDWMTD